MRNTNRPIALRAVADAVENVGVQEVGDNGGPAVTAYLASCVPPLQPPAPWCAAFVRYRMRQSARALELTYDATFPRSAYTPDWANWARKNNKWVSSEIAKENPGSILAGDLALFWFPAIDRIGHIGIVLSVTKTGVITIEGNTSPPSKSGLDRDGDGVYRRTRSWRSLGKHGGFLMVDF